MVQLVEGPRALKPQELDSLVGLTNGVFRADGGDMGADFGYFLNKSNAPHLRVFVEDGEVVAHCGWRPAEATVFGCRLRVGSIGAVCTDPRQRGKGLGTQLLRDNFEDMRAAGVDFAMISGRRGLYTRNSAVLWGPAAEYTFDSAAAGDWLSDVEVTPASSADAAAMAALYRAEPVRFLRPPSEWADIISGRCCMNRPAKLLAVRRGGTLVAYAAAREPRGEEFDPRGTILGEFAGCRSALASALPRCAEASGAPRLLVCLGGWDVTIRAELEARGLQAQAEPGLCGSVRLVNFPQLMERIRPLLVERAGRRAAGVEASAADGKLALSLGAERLEMTEADACSVVFGTRDRSERKLLEGRGELGRVLAAALPLELPWYGYNYV